MTTTVYSQYDDLTEVFVGRRIVAAEMGVDHPFNGGYQHWESRGLEPYGRLTLDDGTQVYVVGNDGGCSCSAGCYTLTELAAFDNIITSVAVEEPTEHEWGERAGFYRIFVYAENNPLNQIAAFEGDDGNGYYGTGFHLTVIPAEPQP